MAGLIFRIDLQSLNNPDPLSQDQCHRPRMNVLFVSHCDFTGNSAIHIFSIAQELRDHGVESQVCVPERPETVHELGCAPFRVLTYKQVLEHGCTFDDRRGPDLVHAWTPRECVREVTQRVAASAACPYLVHLEDNEEAIVLAEMAPGARRQLSCLPDFFLDALVPERRSHPRRYRRFIAAAAGVTALIDRLLEFKPADLRGLVFWPGFDRQFEFLPSVTAADRRTLGLRPEDHVLVYTGNVHDANFAEIRSLYVAVRLLRRDGWPVKLLKTGWNQVKVPWAEGGSAGDGILDLGFVSRASMPRLLALADVLVQPGRSDAFNDYRFPSKVPDFLVSGKPVLLPHTNIGRYLQDGVEALLLREGHAIEIVRTLVPLLRDRERRRQIGQAGRDFALRHLVWSRNVVPIRDFYSELVQPGCAKASCPVAATCRDEEARAENLAKRAG